MYVYRIITNIKKLWILCFIFLMKSFNSHSNHCISFVRQHCWNYLFLCSNLRTSLLSNRLHYNIYISPLTNHVHCNINVLLLINIFTVTLQPSYYPIKQQLCLTTWRCDIYLLNGFSQDFPTCISRNFIHKLNSTMQPFAGCHFSWKESDICNTF